MSDQTTKQFGQQPAPESVPPPPEEAQPSEPIGAEAPEEKEKEDRETREALDELKAALAQLASAATKLGHIAQVKVREEWKTTKPELQKTIEEMKRGVESAATRASSTLDNLAKKVDKPNAGQAETPTDGQAPQAEQPEQQTPPSA